MSEYFVYRFKDGLTYGDFVYRCDDLQRAQLEAIAHKKATGEDYGVFKREEVWSTLQKIQ